MNDKSIFKEYLLQRHQIISINGGLGWKYGEAYQRFIQQILPILHVLHSTGALKNNCFMVPANKPVSHAWICVGI